jgi:carbamoyltransferase
MVCTPQDAYRGFMHSEMDYLVIGNYLFDRADQKPLPQEESEKMRFFLD